MTLIARFITDNIPVLIGDIAISGLPSPHKSVFLPTVGRSSRIAYPDEQKAIIGLCPKIYNFEDNIIIGWTGFYDSAKEFLTELKQLNAKKRLTYVELSKLFLDLSQNPKFEEVTFIGFIKENNKIIDFEYVGEKNNTTRIYSDNFGDVVIAGSGMEHFELLINELNMNFANDNNKDISGLSIAMSKISFLLGNLLDLQIQDPSKILSQYFGGIYEMATFLNGNAQKIDLTYLFWEMEIFQNGNIGMNFPKNGIKLENIDDLLIVRSVTFDYKIDPCLPTIGQDDIHTILPIYDKAKDYTQKIPVMESNIQASYFYVTLPDGRFKLVNILDIGKKNIFIQGSEILINQDLLKRILKPIIESI
jgi:hypothetical protein